MTNKTNRGREFMPFPSGEDFRVDIPDKEMAAAMDELKQRNAEREKEIIEDSRRKLWDELAEPLRTMADILNRIPALNLTNDPELEKIRLQVQSALRMAQSVKARVVLTASLRAQSRTDSPEFAAALSRFAAGCPQPIDDLVTQQKAAAAAALSAFARDLRAASTSAAAAAKSKPKAAEPVFRCARPRTASAQADEPERAAEAPRGGTVQEHSIPAPAPDMDFSRYSLIGQRMEVIRESNPRQFCERMPEEYYRLWAEREKIKNRHGGMPPKPDTLTDVRSNPAPSSGSFNPGGAGELSKRK